MPPLRSCIGLLVSAAGLAACNGGTTEPPPGLALTLDGLLERGSVAHLTVTRNGAPLAPGDWQVTASPTSAIAILGGDSIRFVGDGSVTLAVSSAGRRGERTVEVAAPPVVFFDRSHDGNRDIYRVDLDGLNLTRLTSDAGTDQDPTVAAGRVVFVSFRSGNADLWSSPAAGGGDTRLTSTARNETAPALSRDGSRLAYAYDGALVSKLWTANGDGTGAARATEGFGFNGSIESSPAWAPAGNRIAFMSTAAGSADIYDFSPGGTPSGVAQSDAADVEPAWSPDGQMLAFVSARADGNTDLYLVRLSTGAVTRLTSAPQTEGQPAWAPDSRRLVFTDFADGARRLRWLNVDRPEVIHSIDTGPGRAENPALQP